MLEFISVVQFHETEGSKTIAKYPSLQKEIEENLPAYVLPEGLHRFSQDSNMVLVRKPIFIKEFSEHPKFQLLGRIVHKIHLFEYGEADWKQISPDSHEGCRLKLEIVNEVTYLNIVGDWNFAMDIELHKDLQYTVLEKNFASFYTISGEAYGIQFIENTQIDFESLLNFSLDTTPIEKAVYETKILYCITYCSVKKDQDFVRGANIMGIAAGTYSKHFNSLKPVLARVLDELFCNRQNIRKTIRKIFTSINAAPWPNLQITESEKKVWKWCSDRGYSKNNLNSCVQINYSNPVYLELDITLLEDEIISVSLLRLFEIFRGDLMKIYNGVMQEKRVVVFSQEKNCEFIGNMACAVARLVSPPLPYVASLHLSPFIHLNSLDVLNSSFFIAGANNPLFKIRTQWWDVLADLDTGAVVSSIVLPNVHKDFIENLDSILQQESHKELCIRSQFYDYTQHIIECSLNSEEFENFECKINSEKCGNLALQYCLIKQNALGTKKNDLKIKLLKLRLSHMKSVTFQIDEIYKEIYKGLKGKTECFELLGLMPNSGDLHCIAWAFFTENTTAWKYACKILTRLEEVPEGEFLVTSLPTSELNAYLAYKHRQ